MLHTVHSLPEKELPRADRLVQSLGFRLGIVPISIAGAIQEQMRQVYGGKVTSPLIPNGIDLTPFSTALGRRQEVRHRLNLEDGDIAFICVARFSEVKNHLGLVQAFAQVKSRATLLLVGDGELRKEIQDHVVSLNLQNQIRFLGVRSDIPELLAASDVFVLASHFEGNPLSVMEALACGLPVVATRVGGLPDLVNESNGRLVEASDMQALGYEMENLVSNAALRKELSKGALQSAGSFSIESTAEQYIALYRRALIDTYRRL